ncbi:hypothetical protein BV898_13133 [Hypsibius exemplaris]|uniref:Uncharacterized protein n=1 Tax=Hypsibius exemplaris TaxID=2072580 RepID=A0A1W0WBQ9_HYPEX|nr:hypothetical protein BV898_13133 [Hypsibius exemplaris]
MADASEVTRRNQMCAALRGKRIALQLEVAAQRRHLPGKINDNLNDAITTAQRHERRNGLAQAEALDKSVRDALRKAAERQGPPPYPAVVSFDDPPDIAAGSDQGAEVFSRIEVKVDGKRSTESENFIRAAQNRVDLMRQEVFRMFGEVSQRSSDRSINDSIEL